MSDTNRADTSTEFADAFKEAAEEHRQPDEGRAATDGLGGEGTGGADTDAGTPPADVAQTADAGTLPAEGKENSDEWAKLTPEQLRDRAIAAEERAKRAENTLRSNQGRFSKAERELHELRLRSASAEPKPAAKEDQAPAVDLDGTLASLREEYPEVGDKVSTVFAALQSKVTELEKAGATQAEIRAAEERVETQRFLEQQEHVLTDAVPDWKNVVKMTEYAEWCEQQPRFIQELIVRNGDTLVDGEAAVEVLSRFKRDTQPQGEPDPNKARRDAQLEGSRQIPSRVPALDTTGTGDGGDFGSEWKRAAEEDRRRKPA